MSDIFLFYTDLEDWKGDWLPVMSGLSTHLSSATTQLGNMDLPVADFGDCNVAFNAIKAAVAECIEAIEHSVGKSEGRKWNQLITDGIYVAAELPESTITWDTIVTAWREAPLVGRASTVITIDAMRKQIWDEHVSFKDLAFPEGF